MTEAKRPITADDLLTLQSVGDPQISPDGAHVAFVRTIVDRDKNKTRGEIWLVSADGSRAPRRFTGGTDSVGGPRWSPDGTRIAFVSDRQEETAQVFLIPADGGEAQPLTKLEQGSIQGLRWSADGSHLAFLYRAIPAAYTKKAVEERKEKGLSSPPRVHTALAYRQDGFGYWDGSYWQVYVANAETGEAKALTSGDLSCAVPCWSPDGKTLAFLSDRRPDWDATGTSDDQLWTVPAEGGELTPVPSPPGGKSALAWSLDGQTFAYVGNPDPHDQWGTNNDRVYVLPVTGGETARDLTGQTDKAVGALTIADTGDGSGEDLLWSADGSRLVSPISENGDTRLYSVPVEGGEATPLTPEGHVAGGFTLAGDTVALTLGHSTAPSEVYALRGGQLSPLTDLNRPWRDEIALQTPEPFALDTGDGGTVPGWFLTPPDFTPDGTAPFVLFVHGGPHLQYGNALFHELQWLAAQGYVVAYANPRGSKGYGEAHTKAIKGHWGTPALADVERVADEAIRRGYADPKRTAIMGGSYGGYLTAWAVGHTDRFACAIADRMVAALPSMSGTTDFPWAHGSYYGGNAWDDPADLWQNSPLAFAGKINTPLLLIHSDGDLRCPVSQAEELFAALRLQRKPVEFVRYPAETSHGLSRSGPPDLRLDRLARNLAWLDKYLKAQES